MKGLVFILAFFLMTTQDAPKKDTTKKDTLSVQIARKQIEQTMGTLKMQQATLDSLLKAKTDTTKKLFVR
jgi:hypothetical protein